MTPFFFLSALGCFTRTRELLRVPLDLHTVFAPSGRHTLSIVSLSPGTYRSSRSLGAGWLVCEDQVDRCWSGSEVLLHHSIRISVGLEHLSQVSDLRPLHAAVTYLLRFVSQTLDDASFDPHRAV